MSTSAQDEGRDALLNEVLLEYVDACDAGQVPDRSRILAMHPELRDDLLLFFDQRDRLDRFGGFVRQRKSSQTQEVEIGQNSSVAVPDAISGQLGDFRLIREVGRGGMGIVYEAEQISLGRRVAVKILPFASALDPRQLQRFKNEASAAAHLRHENIVAVHSVGCERGVHYFAMQFVEGESLSSLIGELRRSHKTQSTESTVANARLSTERQTGGESKYNWIAKVGRQAALALEHAHQTGVIHRDIKPGNLLLDAQQQLWITDFGLAHIANDGGLTMTGELLGTLRYASPEQTLGRRGLVDHRSDIYSLGATLYELLTLQPPFDGSDRHELLRQITYDDPPSPRSVVSDIPESLETIVLKALRKDPADRYVSAQDFADDLQRFLDRRPILARPPGLKEHLWSLARRHPVAIMSGAVTLILVTAASILIAVLLRAEQERTRAEQRRTQMAYRTERLRAEQAESRFKLAKRAVDEMLHIGEEEFADRPEMALLRKRVLRSALSFYQEFLAERHGNHEEHVELLETAERVVKILSDLEILRSSTHMYLLCQPSVLTELDLSESQRTQLELLTSRAGKEWIEIVKDIGLMTPNQRASRILDHARANDTALGLLLSAKQHRRLRQIGLQSEGATAFRDPEVAKTIGLTSQQQDWIRVIEDDATNGWKRGRFLPKNEAATTAPMPTPSERILALLSEDQLRKWRDLTGEPIEHPHLPFCVPMTAAADPIQPEGDANQ